MIQDSADQFVLQLWHAAIPVTAIVTCYATLKAGKRRNGKPNGMEAGIGQLHRDMGDLKTGQEKMEAGLDKLEGRMSTHHDRIYDLLRDHGERLAAVESSK